MKNQIECQKKEFKVKLTDVWKELKSEYLKTVVLIQYGNFYRVFGDDSYIIYFLMGYHIYDNKVGFPISEVEKVKNRLEEYRINYYFYGKMHYQKYFEDNGYSDILELGRNKYYKKSLLEELKKYDCIEDLELLLGKYER